MLLGNPHLYEEARAAKLGQRNLPPVLELLRQWMSEKYAIHVLHLVYDRIELGPCTGRPRLSVVVDTQEDYQRMFEEPLTIKEGVELAVLRRFSEIVSQAQATTEYDTTDVHLLFDDFSDVAMSRASEQFRKNDKLRVLNEYPQCRIWDISGFAQSVVVFYLTNKDVERNAANGCSDSIRRRCCELAKQYDEFDYFRPETFPIIFDSKERLDRDFCGSLFYYFR